MSELRDVYHGLITKLKENEIFVFGSNPEGRHGRGAANTALKRFGAIWGKGRGLQGKSYGLVTKNLQLNYIEPSTGIVYRKSGPRSLSKAEITANIKELYQIAKKHPQLLFMIAYTAGSENLNGYSDQEMAEMFASSRSIPQNIVFEDRFNQLVFS